MSSDASDAKSHILNTSVQLFSTQGYKETTIRNISKVACVNVSMISYYFGGKDGILKEIVKGIAEGLSSLLSQFDLNDMAVTMDVLKRLLSYLENHRSQIKILFNEMGKESNYFSPVKKEIKELQSKLSKLILSKNHSSDVIELEQKLKIMTDIILGMIFSDYIFDFSSFQDSSPEEKLLWREDRVQMLMNILKQLSGLNTGQLTFESIM